MAYPLQPYNLNNGGLVGQQLPRPIFNGGNSMGGSGGDLFGALSGLVNQLMGELLRNGPGIDGTSSFMCSDPNNPHLKVFGVSSMNVTQISRGLDGRPHIVQTHNESVMGPGGVWQTKKALRDPDRGIEKMQIGYFNGDRGQIIEHRLDPITGQFQQEIQRHGLTHNVPNFSQQWPFQYQQFNRQQPLSPFQQYQYYLRRQQRTPFYPQQRTSFYGQQRPPVPPSYGQQQPQALPLNAQKPYLALPAPSSYQPF